MPIPLGILAQAGRTISSGSYELISSTILTSSQSSVTFSNLGDYSSTYQHLQIRYTGRSTRSGNNDSYFYLQFNGDTAANYRQHYIRGNGTDVASSDITSSYPNGVAILFGLTAATSVSGSFGAGVIDILDPYEAKNKTIRALAGSTDINRIGLNSGAWFSTNSVTSITLDDIFGNFAQYSRFSLYGIKGA